MNEKAGKIVIVVAGIVIVLMLGLSVVMALFGSGKAGEAETKVSKKEIEALQVAGEESMDGDVQVIPIDEDLTFSPSGASTEAADDSKAAGEDDKDYILPNSDKELLTDADVSGLSKDDLRLARNEIMARHGRTFNDETLQSYFESKDWYEGTVDPDTFDKNLSSYLSETELANVDMIKKYE